MLSASGSDTAPTPAPHQGLEPLRQAVKAGDSAAATELAGRLLAGRDAPFSPDEGMSLLRSAVERGSARAASTLATLAAGGAWTPQSWPEALDLLRRAAEGGEASAQGQLRLLADGGAHCDGSRYGAPDDPARWGRMAHAVDIAAWMAPLPRRPICEAPRVRMIDGFATPQVCDWLIGKGRGRMKRAMMYDGVTKEVGVADTRTNSDFIFDIVSADLIVLLVRHRVSAILNIPTVAMEPPQIFHYAVGQELRAHYDTLRMKGSGYANTDYQGDRIATFLLYLNDDYEGGDLHFPKTGFSCRGRKGDGLMLANVDPQGAPDRLSLHAAMPVTKGEKWILSQWIHDRPFSVAV